jgi:hypothetical protein
LQVRFGFVATQRFEWVNPSDRLLGERMMQGRREYPDMMPDTVNLIIWLIAGVAGGNAAGDLLKGYNLGPGNSIAGAIGGVVGALILQTLIPALRGFDVVSIVGQILGAAGAAAVLTIVAGAVNNRRHQRR